MQLRGAWLPCRRRRVPKRHEDCLGRMHRAVGAFGRDHGARKCWCVRAAGEPQGGVIHSALSCSESGTERLRLPRRGPCRTGGRNLRSRGRLSGLSTQTWSRANRPHPPHPVLGPITCLCAVGAANLTFVPDRAYFTEPAGRACAEILRHEFHSWNLFSHSRTAAVRARGRGRMRVLHLDCVR